MKSVLFALDGVLRDAQGEPIKDNIALYCAGHDKLWRTRSNVYLEI